MKSIPTPFLWLLVALAYVKLGSAMYDEYAKSSARNLTTKTTDMISEVKR
jgi:hypothetical protein